MGIRKRRTVVIGERFGKLTVTGFVQNRNGTAVCHCDCGRSVNVFASSLVHKKIVSCGCISPRIHDPEYHGMFGTPEYDAWSGIKARCYNKRSRSYKDYGGRGITMSEEWKSSLLAFVRDMGLKPNADMSVGRIDNSKGYCKENCRWETSEEQMQNTRYNVNLTLNGETMCVTAWARRIGIKPGTLFGRINKGWPVERVLSHPVGGHKKSDRIIEHDGKAMNVTEWSEATGIPRSVIYGRLSNGWPVEACLTFPVAKRTNRRHSSFQS